MQAENKRPVTALYGILGKYFRDQRLGIGTISLRTGNGSQVIIGAQQPTSEIG